MTHIAHLSISLQKLHPIVREQRPEDHRRRHGHAGVQRGLRRGEGERRKGGAHPVASLGDDYSGEFQQDVALKFKYRESDVLVDLG